MSSLLWTIDPSGENLSAASLVSEEGRQKLVKYFPSWDKYGANNGPYNTAATNIYKTKDGKFFHIHGKLIDAKNPRVVGMCAESSNSKLL
jgi:hypothetical protein